MVSIISEGVNDRARNIGYIINESAPEESYGTKVIKEIQCGSRKRVVGFGKLQDVEVLNRNRRWYGHDDMQNEVMSDRLQKELIPRGRMLGENGHPIDTNLTRQQKVDEGRCSVRYLKVWMEGNDVFAWYVGHNNDLGDTFDDNLRSGILPSFSLRALGSLVQTPKGAKVQGLRVITWDDVIYPSHMNAYTLGLVSKQEYDAQCKNVGIQTESAILTESFKIAESINESGRIIPINNKEVMKFIKNESQNLHILGESFDANFGTARYLKESGLVFLDDSQGTTYAVNVESYVQNGIMNHFLK